MPDKTKNPSHKIDSTDFIYISILIIFFLIVAFVFYLSSKFLIQNINKIFTQTDQSTLQALDKNRYSLIEKKLDLPINPPTDFVKYDAPVEITPVIETPTIQQVKVLDPKILSINIINAAKKAGVASGLAKSLETDGFAKATLSDNPMSQTTTIAIKESQQEYATLIEAAVKKLYPKATIISNPETSAFDVIIKIGR